MSLEFKSREVHINAIRVPWDNLPGADKIAKCYGFYRQHGFLDRVIVVDGQYWLRDGLAGLMVARAVGLKRVKVLQVTEKKDKPETKPEAKTEGETAVAPTAPAAPKRRPWGPLNLQLPEEVKCATKLRVFCVHSFQGLALSITRGRVYTFDEGMQYNEGTCPHRSQGEKKYQFGDWCEQNHEATHFVVPLIHRPAQVGEWVRVRESVSTGRALDGGDICQVISHRGNFTTPCGYVYVAGKKYVSPGQRVYLSPDEYDVLEGYDGRFEPTPEETTPPPETDQPTSLKTPCDCYHERESGPHGVISECWGTREREECSCHGYRELCTFYPEHRKSPTTETGGSHETEV